jgi:uncharacterized membrane protein YcaP (DUF421 family)
MDARELLLTCIRAAAVYTLILVVIRALGKRTVGSFSAFDLLVAVMLGDLVGEIIYGDVEFVKGIVAILTLAGLSALNVCVSVSNRRVRTLLEGQPTIIVRNGELLDARMRAERLNMDEVMAMLRLQGVQDLREVRLATVEPDGELSVLRYDWAEPAARADVDPAAAREREAASLRTRRTDSDDVLGDVGAKRLR